MASTLIRKLQAAALATVILLPASSAFANDWSKHMSRTRGATIGAVAGAVLGPPGVVAGAAIGNGVQAARHHIARKSHHRTVHYRHYRTR